MSHGGKYIAAWVLKASSLSKQEDKWQIVVPPLDPCAVGPVFIEVPFIRCILINVHNVADCPHVLSYGSPYITGKHGRLMQYI